MLIFILCGRDNLIHSRCSSIDQEPLRFLIGDVYGRLSLLSLESVNETGLVLVPLGEVWIFPSVLTLSDSSSRRRQRPL